MIAEFLSGIAPPYQIPPSRPPQAAPPLPVMTASIWKAPHLSEIWKGTQEEGSELPICCTPHSLRAVRKCKLSCRTNKARSSVLSSFGPMPPVSASYASGFCTYLSRALGLGLG